MSATKKTCGELVEGAMESRMADLKVLYRLHDCDADEILGFCEEELIEIPDDLDLLDADSLREGLYEQIEEHSATYGLAFDYVEPEDGDNPFFRFQISWGGPSEEVRFHLGYGRQPFLLKAEFWYLDWFDGACLTLTGDMLETAQVMLDSYSLAGCLVAETGTPNPTSQD